MVEEESGIFSEDEDDASDEESEEVSDSDTGYYGIEEKMTHC